MKAKDLDTLFEAGKDISAHLDKKRAKLHQPKPHRVNVDFPAWVVASLDKEAQRLGVTRQSLIKLWIADRIQAV